MKILKRLRRKAQKLLYKEQYSLIVRDKRTGEEARFRPPSLGCIWADPFPIERDGQLFLFIEQEYSRQKGEIGYIKVAPDMTRSEYATALKKPYHLSYPHLFECGGNLYMIPETNENNTIDCYVCASFPNTTRRLSAASAR